jgi:hypothetical protein
MLGTQLHSISEALDLIKRAELMEEQDCYQRPPNCGSGPPQSLAIPGTTKTEIQDKVKCAISNNITHATGFSDNKVPDATMLTEGETKIQEVREHETLNPGMPQRPLSENKDGRAPEGLIGVIIWKTNPRRD